MARNRKGKPKRRQQHGSAWHWKQTDCWYYTPPGTRQRVPLLDEHGQRIRGVDNKEAAQLALARVKLANEMPGPSRSTSGDWTVAKVCDVYLNDLHQTASPEWAAQVQNWLNDLCGYCGALQVSELKKKHLRTWILRHKTWNNNSQRNVIGSVIAAFNFCCKFDELDHNPLAGYEKPAATPRVTAFSPEEEEALYLAADEAFGQFLRACILTGARPYSELAKITADHIVESPQGMAYVLKASTADGRQGHKTAKKTGKDRRILLCDEMEVLTRRMVLAAPADSGRPLFRSTRGRPWKKCNCIQRFLDLKRKLKLPDDRCVYTCRHTFAKRTLSGYYTGTPVTIEVLAGLMGNTPKVCWDHYAQWSDQYNDPLWAALGKQKPRKVAS